MPRVKRVSRAKRWSDAVTNAVTAVSDLQSALEELQSIQQEFEDWKDNLPENLSQSALGEKLDEVCELGIEDALSSLGDIDSLVQDCDGADLPLGFGRD